MVRSRAGVRTRNVLGDAVGAWRMMVEAAAAVLVDMLDMAVAVHC